MQTFHIKQFLANIVYISNTTFLICSASWWRSFSRWDAFTSTCCCISHCWDDTCCKVAYNTQRVRHQPAIYRSWLWLLVGAWLHNDFTQVVQTLELLTSSSIICYWSLEVMLGLVHSNGSAWDFNGNGIVRTCKPIR